MVRREMPSLLQQPFPALIRAIPTALHSFELEAEPWQPKFNEAGCGMLWEAIFGGQDSIRISRDRLLNYIYPNQQQKCAEVLLWGYPRDMRGMVSRLLPVIEQVSELAASEEPWPNYYHSFRRQDLTGIGLSTITKLAYFFRKEFEGHSAVILDSRVNASISRWQELQVHLGVIANRSWRHYLPYLHALYGTAALIECTGEQLELFLFAFGKNF